MPRHQWKYKFVVDKPDNNITGLGIYYYASDDGNPINNLPIYLCKASLKWEHVLKCCFSSSTPAELALKLTLSGIKMDEAKLALDGTIAELESLIQYYGRLHLENSSASIVWRGTIYKANQIVLSDAARMLKWFRAKLYTKTREKDAKSSAWHRVHKGKQSGMSSRKPEHKLEFFDEFSKEDAHPAS
jgi:hypothetical protein